MGRKFSELPMEKWKGSDPTKPNILHSRGDSHEYTPPKSLLSVTLRTIRNVCWKTPSMPHCSEKLPQCHTALHSSPLQPSFQHPRHLRKVNSVRITPSTNGEEEINEKKKKGGRQIFTSASNQICQYGRYMYPDAPLLSIYCPSLYKCKWQLRG